MILVELTLMNPEPAGSRTILPLASVDEIVLPLIVILSTFRTSILLDASTISAELAVRTPGW